ncbi:recombinase family protein [Streptomyces alboniger]|uniref:recombinase family protein n=1 Tax=Streptomyces alboniger TaxID=132473 RepID=UPI0018F87CB6
MRTGYARTSAAHQELASQLEALHRAECHKVFQEQISTCVKVRPELEKALALARQFREAAPETPVIFERNYIRRPRATTADGRRPSTTTCSPSPSRSMTRASPSPKSRRS